MIELMVALVISSMLVGMILSIYMRISLAYRGQQQVASVQQVLSAARNVIETDAKQSGFAMAQGFKIATDGGVGGKLHSPVVITNSSTGPDQIAFFYADPTTQAVVSAVSTTTQIVVDSSTGFAVNDLVVMATPDILTMANPLGATDAKIALFDACVVKISGIAGNTISFTTATPWGNAGNDHCATPALTTTMLYKFTAHAYRIDTARPSEGVLQMSATGNLQTNVNDWQDLGFGFTDIQVATMFFESGDTADTADPGTDPQRDWYSSTEQATKTAPTLKTVPFIPPLQMSISVVARTDRDVEGISTAFTPTLTVSTNASNNTLGDHAAVDLSTTNNAALTGNRIYRYATFQVDLRNLGVGR